MSGGVNAKETGTGFRLSPWFADATRAPSRKVYRLSGTAIQSGCAKRATYSWWCLQSEYKRLGLFRLVVRGGDNHQNRCRLPLSSFLPKTQKPEQNPVSLPPAVQPGISWAIPTGSAHLVGGIKRCDVCRGVVGLITDKVKLVELGIAVAVLRVGGLNEALNDKLDRQRNGNVCFACVGQRWDVSPERGSRTGKLPPIKF